MKRFLMSIPLMALVLMPLDSTFGQTKKVKKLSEADIVTLNELQIDAQTIVERLKKSGGPGFEVSNEVLQRMEKTGVSEPVLAALRKYLPIGSFAPNTAALMKIPAKKGEEFRCMHFVNPSVGYVASNKAVYKTSDGGKNWQNVLDAEFLKQGTSFIRFLDEKTGWIFVYGQLYVTTDGGKTWSPDQGLVRAAGMTFDSERRIYLYGLGEGLRPQIYRKENPKAEWSKIPMKHKDFPYASDLVDVSILGPKTYHVHVGNSSTRKGWIMVTTDGGKNWEKAFEHNPLTDCHLNGKGQGWLLAADAIFHSTDNGANWHKALNPTGRHGLTMQFDPNGSTLGVVLLGYFGESDRSTKLLVTRDGKSWMPVNVNKMIDSPDLQPDKMQMVNANCIYLLTSSGDLIRYSP